MSTSVEGPSPTVDVPEIDVDELAELHAQGVTIIDVRNPDEYVGAHVPGARLIPLSELAERAGEIPADEPVYLICASGPRSRRAGEFLAAQGLDVTNIVGGTKGWMNAGHPIHVGDQP